MCSRVGRVLVVAMVACTTLATAACAHAAPFFTEGFEGVTPPAIPAGWGEFNSFESAPHWTTTNINPITGAQSVFGREDSASGHDGLDSPFIQIPNAPSEIQFNHTFDLENVPACSLDAAALLIAIGGADFTDITAAGGTFLAGGYNTTLCGGNPIAANGVTRGWSGASNGIVHTVAALPAAAQGKMVSFEFAIGTDNTTAENGWKVDDISLSPIPPPTTPTAAAAVQPTVIPVKKCKRKRRHAAAAKKKCRRKKK